MTKPTKTADQESYAIGRLPCPNCRKDGGDSSGDNLTVYSDNHGFCFACNTHYKDVNSDMGNVVPLAAPATQPNDWTPIKGVVRALDHRGITLETARLFNYRVAKVNGEVVEVANYYENGELIGQKIRKPGKRFQSQGNMKGAPLWGQLLCRSGGKFLTVTEGEIDAMSASQMQGNKWPTVSIPNGAAGAVEAFKRNLEFLNSFEGVKIVFDNDEPGTKAAHACAKLLRPGKAQIVTLPLKDANEHLMKGETQSYISAWWNAKTFRPDGIVAANEVDLSVAACAHKVWEYPWDSLTKVFYGRKAPELVMHASGSGMGKSTAIRELIDHSLRQGETVGVMMLEESVQDTIHHLMSLRLNKPIRKILAARAVNDKLVAAGRKAIDFGVEDNLSAEEYASSKAELLNSGKLFLFDHWGSLDSENLMNKLDYMAISCGCSMIFIDHISILVSGLDSGNERKDIDILMTRLREFVQQTKVHVDAVCHLTKPKGTPFEEGGQISLRDFRGSGALYQLSDLCIAYERNQQHVDRDIANTVIVRSLKDRFGGFTGIAGALKFDTSTGRLNECEWEIGEDGNVTFSPQKDKTVSYTEIIEPDFTDEELINE